MTTNCHGTGQNTIQLPPLEKYFDTANFELDLRTGRAHTYSTPPVYIGIPCQEEEFDLKLLLEMLENGHDSDEPQMQELE